MMRQMDTSPRDGANEAAPTSAAATTAAPPCDYYLHRIAMAATVGQNI